MIKVLIDRATVEQALEALEDMLGWQSLAPQTIQESAKGRAAALRSALAEPEPCQYPDCVDNGPDGKCIRWLLDECSKSEDYKPQRPAEPQEPDSPERRCGGPGCDMKCCQPVQEPAPMPPFPPVSLWKRGCAVCGIGAGGHAYGYACPRSDCPTRVTCGGTV